MRILPRSGGLAAPRWLARRPAPLSTVGLIAGTLFLAASLTPSLVPRALDSSFQQLDARIEAELAPPTDPARTGSEASRVDWKSLGRTGRGFVSSGPSLEDLRAFLGGAVAKPIRVYVGLNSAGDIASRARLAVEELEPTGAFERPVLVIATPTGTGWIDPSAIEMLEPVAQTRDIPAGHAANPAFLNLDESADGR